MGYERALIKAWSELRALSQERTFSVKFLADTYDLDVSSGSILSLSCNIPAKDYQAILILHYLITKLRLGRLPENTGEWIDFNQLDGGDAYYSVFRKRTINPIITKYGHDPMSLLKVCERLPASIMDVGDASLLITVFEGVNVRITLWKGDEEFGPDANILFDRTIKEIFCTEDIVVLSEYIARSI